MNECAVLDMLENKSFSDVLTQRELKPRAFNTNLERMEAVELMAMVHDAGNCVLTLARRNRISATHAEVLLNELLSCFAEPLVHQKRVIEITRELKGYRE